MRYSKQIVEKVVDEFAKKRQAAFDIAFERRQQMYAEAPMLERIDFALSMTGPKIYKAALEGSDGLEDKMAALRKENMDLQDDRRRILEACGKSADYLEPHFECSKCEDTGYCGLKMCECMRKALIKEAYISSGLGAALKEQGFDNFRLDYYSANKKSDGISPRENMENILSAAKNFVKNFGDDDKGENLLFIGKTGLGKTHISSAIAKGVIDKGYDVVYDTVQNILHSYELQTFGGSDNNAVNTEKYMDCSLLIIDDLGTEFKNSFTNSVLYNLLNSRIISGKSMIISTNLDSSLLLQKQYDDRILSRLIGNFRTFSFFGDDLRIKRAAEKRTSKDKKNI